jgi:hypothetical protein
MAQPPDQFDALAFVEQHITGPQSESFKLGVSERHLQNIANSDLPVEHIRHAKIGSERSLGLRVASLPCVNSANTRDSRDLPVLWYFANFGLFEILVSAGETTGEQLGHQGLLHDLELVDHGPARLDGVVHRRQDGRDLPLLGEGRANQVKVKEALAG